MIAKVERLVNLTIALLEARQPLTFEEVRRRTGLYEQSDPESARRMFERDKDLLRSLGVPIELRMRPADGQSGYFVDRRAYELPDVELTREEISAVSVALRAMGSEADRLALSKIAARAPDAAPDGTALPARFELDASATDPVAEAVVERRVLTFAYRDAAGIESTRTLDPYAIVQRRGTWYVVGRDHDRDAARAFRLDRLVGRARTVGGPGAFARPDGFDAAQHVAGPAGEDTEILIALAPAATWHAIARGAVDAPTDPRTPDGWTTMRWQAPSARALPWLLGLGSEVVVLEPAQLRTEVIAALTAVAEDAST